MKAATAETKEVRRLAYFLPNVFTALNMACGFACVIYATKGDFYKACMILILGSIFDSVDGRVARLTGTQSAFGEMFDSISDVISFGMAPAMLVYNCFLTGLGRAGLIIAFFYLLCGALRLARFNANIDRVSSDYFQGLPIPSAALSLVGLCLLSTEVAMIKDYPAGAVVYVLFFSLLMISNVPFYAFKSANMTKKHKKKMLLVIFILLGALFMHEEYMVIAIMNTYVFAALIYALIHKRKIGDLFDIEEAEND